MGWGAGMGYDAPVLYAVFVFVVGEVDVEVEEVLDTANIVSTC